MSSNESFYLIIHNREDGDIHVQFVFEEDGNKKVYPILVKDPKDEDVMAYVKYKQINMIETDNGETSHLICYSNECNVMEISAHVHEDHMKNNKSFQWSMALFYSTFCVGHGIRPGTKKKIVLHD